MSLFGKFMAVLNFFGVGAVIVMALLVYSQRRVWEYAVFRADLAMYGLPLDKAEMDNQDNARAEDLGSPTGRTLKDLFPTNPVSTQVDEVIRVKGTLDGTLSGVNSNPQAHMQALASILLPLSVSNAQREYYLTIQTQCNTTKPNDNQPAPWDVLKKRLEQAYNEGKANAAKNKTPFAREFSLALRFPEPPGQPGVVPPQGLQVLLDGEPREPFEEAFLRAVQPDANVPPSKEFPAAFEEAVTLLRADLQKQYDAAFEVALKGQHTSATGQTQAVGPDQRRHAIARLLIGLEVSLPKDAVTIAKEDPVNTDLFALPAFKRVVNVIGLEEANTELNAEASIYARISLELDKQTDRERTTFVLEHQTLIAEAQTAAQKLAQQDDQVKELKEKVAAQTALVAQREANVVASRNELAARRAYTAQLLDMVRQMEDAVHTTRVDVRDANTVNQGYVEKIKELENKR